MDKFLARLRSIKIQMPRNVKLPRLGRVAPRQMILWGAAIVVAVGFFGIVRGFTTCWQLTSLPGVPPASCKGSGSAGIGPTLVDAQGTPVILPTPADVTAPEVTYPQWDGGSRVNIVFFGLRGGETAGEDCPLCTDTIIVFTVDPVTKTAGMMSIPRDMFVNIPGFGYSRINTAWTDGEGSKLPGGGPGLAMKTVSQFLGVPIQYYAQVDFQTFIDFVNMIHGIDVYNDEDLRLARLGGGKDTIKITCCGMRHLGGPAALAYARCRDVEQGCNDGDVGRSKRQQKVILAIRDKVLSPQYFPTLMSQAPQLYNLFSSGIHTNMPLDDAIKLAALAQQIPYDQVKQGLIDNHMANFGNVTLGGQNASILMPIPDKIREVRDQIFTSGGATSPMATGDPQALMQADGARVRITNNTYTADLDTRTGNFLLAQGMQVTERGAPTGASDRTVVVVYSPKLYALRYLINPLGMISNSNQILFKPDASSSVDLEIRLGNDWVSKLPPGF
jgi:polyisoprenyl-teichoic acid--peptidoglycan teichoic acid transferase